MKNKHLFEISVYRLNENTYYAEMQKHISKNDSNIHDYVRKQYGGVWQYNEIIGFLKFYQYGANKIRCEYWETDAQRIVRTRKKLFIKSSDKYCDVLFSKNDTNAKLAMTMKDAVKHCEDRLMRMNKKRYIDKEIFNNMVDYVSWNKILT